MTNQHRDAELVEAARGGDSEAFATLVDCHRPLVIALARRALGNSSLAEDAVQEATLIAMLRLDRLQDPRQFRSWFAGIALNVCRRWRSEGWFVDYHSWETWADNNSRVEPVDWRPGPPDLVEAADLSERVFQAVSGLPPGQRTVILLFYVFGLSYAEIATRLGIEVSAVKARLHKARRTLRRKLADLWQEEHLGAMVETAREAHRVVDDDARHEALVVQIVLGGGQWLPLWTARNSALRVAERVPAIVRSATVDSMYDQRAPIALLRWSGR